jgi:L-Ala-D/L-Glu epimerase
MNIANLQAEVVRAPYRRPFGITGGTSEVLESLLVRVTDDDGAEGIGEVNPMPAYSGVELDEVCRCLDEVAPRLVGVRPEPGQVHEVLSTCGPGPARTFARAAIDIAIHDLMGQRAGCPVHRLLGGALREEVDLAWVVGLGPVDETVQESVERAQDGYRTLKLKVGRDPRRDVAAVQAVRRELPGVVLRVDANAGWTATEAIDVLRRLEGCDLELVEQPVAGDDLGGLAHVRRETGARILADESLQSTADAIALVRADACDAFNIKITKPGGLHPARAIVAIADAAGVGVMVGSMPELGVASTAGLHLALTLRTQPYACELLGPFMVTEDVVTWGGIERVGGTVRLREHAASGLGLEVAR